MWINKCAICRHLCMYDKNNCVVAVVAFNILNLYCAFYKRSRQNFKRNDYLFHCKRWIKAMWYTNKTKEVLSYGLRIKKIKAGLAEIVRLLFRLHNTFCGFLSTGYKKRKMIIDEILLQFDQIFNFQISFVHLHSEKEDISILKYFMNVTKQEFAGVKILVKALLHTAIVFKLNCEKCYRQHRYCLTILQIHHF